MDKAEFVEKYKHLLEKYDVHDPEELEGEHPEGLWAVSDESSIIAYFKDEPTAFMFSIIMTDHETFNLWLQWDRRER